MNRAPIHNLVIVSSNNYQQHVSASKIYLQAEYKSRKEYKWYDINIKFEVVIKFNTLNFKFLILYRIIKDVWNCKDMGQQT